MASHPSSVILAVLIFFATQNYAKEFTPSTNLITPAESPRLEPINGTRNFRMHGKKGKDDKTWFDGREMRYIYCVRPAKCEPIRHKSCLGSSLPYSSISLDLTDSFSQEQTHDKLYQYNALRHVPKCWAVIQPFLCAVFTPKCEKINGRDMVYLPSLEMCKITLEPCRILYNTSYFPEFLKCNETLYPSKCNNDVREEMKFNATGQCLKPLVGADSAANYYKDIEGCGLQCKDPLFTDDEHRQIHKLIAWFAGICLTSNLFTIATFAIDWYNANKYPALVIFYINFCFMVSCLGWLAQFTPGGREDIVCRKDGTLRISEPSAGENLSCIVVFILVYYFLIAAMVWFVIFAYLWHICAKAVGKIQDKIDKKGSYFHLIAWSLPLVLTITIMALSEIDGNSTVGICFVGYLNHPIRGGFVLGPVVCVLLIGGYFLVRGLLTLTKLKISSEQIIPAKTSEKIRKNIVRMGICTALTFMFIVATIFCHIHEFKNTESWALAMRNYILCQISSTYTDVTSVCRLQSRPSVAVLQVHLICLFGSGFVMSSWVWTNSTLDTWGRYFRRRFHPDAEEPVMLPKHKLIARAYAKKNDYQNQGRLSIPLYNSHTDPVGLNFDINSAKGGSHDFSATWANNLPRFVSRRCALTGAVTSSSYDPRKNSVDSEISFSVRHVSVESRRNSVDSQVSVKIAEMKTKVASRSRSGVSGRKHHPKNRRRDFTTSGRRYSRKESSTSVESQVITAIQKGRHSCSSGNSQFFGTNNMQRRTGIGGIDAYQLNNLISNGKLLLPFLHQSGLTTSEEDDVSNGSFKVQDSKYDVILKHIGSAGTSNRADSHNTSCQIEEYHSSDEEKPGVKQSNRDDFTITKDGMKSSKEGGRGSKNSSKSIRSRKSSSRKGAKRKSPKHARASQKSQRNEKKEKAREREREKEREKEQREKELQLSERNNLTDFNDSSFTSYCSELSPLNVNSSYSGISLTKTNSRNSKRSCDVGIQANAYEIATQTMSSFEFSEKALKNEENEDIYTENHALLGPKLVVPQVLQAARKRELVDGSLTEAEKLKQLLLPSK